MLCNKCGSTIKDGLKSCTKCGADLVLTQRTDSSHIEQCFCEPYSFASCSNPSNHHKNKKISSGYKRLFALTTFICILLLFCVTGYFVIHQLVNTPSAPLTKEVAESTGSISIDCSTMQEKVTNEEDAYKVLNSVSDRFGFKNAKEVLDIQKTDVIDDDTYYSFSQKHNGLPVYEKNIILATDRSGKIFYIGGNYLKIAPSFNTQAKLTPEKAKKQIEKQLKKIEKQLKKELIKGFRVSEPWLCIHASTKKTMLTYVSEITGYAKDGTFEAYLIFSNADTGNILYKESRVDYTPDSNDLSYTYKVTN